MTTVLLTSAGGLITPGIIKNLQEIPEVKKVVGIDTNTDAIGSYMVDAFRTVPKGDDPEYIDEIREIVNEQKVDVIIPCSDEEVFTLSRHKESINEAGTEIFCSSHDVTRTAIDKGSMLSFLAEHGITVPVFYLPKTAKELIESAEKIGYPIKPVAVKPRRGRGSRGFKILREDINLLYSRELREMKLEWYIESIGEGDGYEPVVMEYLSGADYSIDVFADHGKPVYIVPRKRIKTIMGVSQVGEIVLDKDIEEFVRKVVEVFGFDYLVNIQMRCRDESDGMPLIYEINPRTSGTIVASKYSGVDLIHCGIRHALNIPQPELAVQPKRMIRYLSEYYVSL